MNLAKICLALGTTLLASSSGWARVVTLDSPAERQPPVLRSAYLLRSLGADFAAHSTTSAERQARLVRHFDLVLQLLAANSPRSIEVALARLERSRGEAWSAADRAAWRQTLALRRLEHLRVLRAYQQRGRFPQNEHADRTVPIFVDNHDTACAVGHLMRESGWADAVAAIERANNFVYVADVHDGPLVEWVLVSGLTQEEAALIQPGYESPPFDATLDVLAAGGFVTHNGLRYDNFAYIAGPLAAPELFPGLPPLTNVVDLSQGGVAAESTVWNDPCCGNQLHGEYDDWMLIGSRDFPGGGSAWVSSQTGEDWGVIYSFDVTPLILGARIAGASVLSTPIFTFNFTQNGRIEVETRVTSLQQPQTLLAELAFDSDDPFSNNFLAGEEAAEFAPANAVRVVTAVRLEDAANFSSLVHSFLVVPEPNGAILVAAALAALLVISRRRSHPGPLAVNYAS